MNTQRSEKGQVLVMIAVLMVGLIGITAVAVDGGRTYAQRRSVQNAADNAALAGGLAKCYSDPVSSTALTAAAANGFDNNGTTNTVSVYNPPVSGPNTGKAEYVEVVISSSIDTTFAQVVYSGDLGADARAVARCRRSYDYAVIALDTDVTVQGIHINGAGTFTVDGGGMISNSHHPTQSILIDGGSGIIEADPVHASGGISGTGFSTTPVPNVPPVPDPLADLPPPPVQPVPGQSTPDSGSSCTSPSPSSNPGLIGNYSGNKTIYLNPGTYCRLTGDAGIDLWLNPGIYYIDGSGGFEGGGTGSIRGEGVMIYMSPTAGASDFSGTSDVDLSACNSTSTYTRYWMSGAILMSETVSAWCTGSYAQYAGMLFYADRSYTQDVSMYGNTVWNAVGTIYAPSSFLNLHGNGTVLNLSSMLIASTILLGGTPVLNVDYDPGTNIQPPLSVQLVE